MMRARFQFIPTLLIPAILSVGCIVDIPPLATDTAVDTTMDSSTLPGGDSSPNTAGSDTSVSTSGDTNSTDTNVTGIDGTGSEITVNTDSQIDDSNTGDLDSGTGSAPTDAPDTDTDSADVVTTDFDTSTLDTGNQNSDSENVTTDSSDADTNSDSVVSADSDTDSANADSTDSGADSDTGIAGTDTSSSPIEEADFFQSDDNQGLVVIEAEAYSEIRDGNDGSAWALSTSPPENFSGTGAMIAISGPEGAKEYADKANAEDHGPMLRYRIHFVKGEPVYVWARAAHYSSIDDSVWYAMNGVVGIDSPLCFTVAEQPIIGEWHYILFMMNDDIARIDIADPGVKTVELYMREPGFLLDRIVLTSDANFDPSTLP